MLQKTESETKDCDICGRILGRIPAVLILVYTTSTTGETKACSAQICKKCADKKDISIRIDSGFVYFGERERS